MLQSLFLAVPLNKLQADAEGKEEQQWWNKSKNDTTETGASWSVEHLEGKKAVVHTTYVEP